MSKKRRQYTREFELEAVRMVEEGGQQVGQVARDLGTLSKRNSSSRMRPCR